MKDLKNRLKNHLADKDREWEWYTNGGDNEEKLKILVEKNSTNEMKKRWMNKEDWRISKRKRKKRKEKMRKIQHENKKR